MMVEHTILTDEELAKAVGYTRLNKEFRDQLRAVAKVQAALAARIEADENAKRYNYLEFKAGVVEGRKLQSAEDAQRIAKLEKQIAELQHQIDLIT